MALRRHVNFTYFDENGVEDGSDVFEEWLRDRDLKPANIGVSLDDAGAQEICMRVAESVAETEHPIGPRAGVTVKLWNVRVTGDLELLGSATLGGPE